MSNINVPWEVEGVISPEVSVGAMIDVIQSKGIQHSGTFWTWEDEVRESISRLEAYLPLTYWFSHTLGSLRVRRSCLLLQRAALYALMRSPFSDYFHELNEYSRRSSQHRLK
jgi:hypothetical protein